MTNTDQVGDQLRLDLLREALPYIQRFQGQTFVVKLSGKALDPVIEYPHNAGLAGECKFPDHSPGQSITGGYVYRGKAMPPLQGAYIYADFQNGTIWGLKYEGGRVTARGTLSKENGGRQIASFAEDADGEIYVLAFDSKIYQVTLKQ